MSGVRGEAAGEGEGGEAAAEGEGRTIAALRVVCETRPISTPCRVRARPW